MKLLSMVAVLGASSLPILAGLGIGWLHSGDIGRVAEGEDVNDVAKEIAEREFGGNVTLEVLDSWSTHNVTGTYGDDIRADPGREYRHVTIEVVNHGRLDIGVHTYHFTAYDDSHRRSKAVLGIEEAFEEMQVGSGAGVDGTVVFDMAKGAPMTRIVWQGELYDATLDL